MHKRIMVNVKTVGRRRLALVLRTIRRTSKSRLGVWPLASAGMQALWTACRATLHVVQRSDPAFAAKLKDVVGLYVDPPDYNRHVATTPFAALSRVVFSPSRYCKPPSIASSTRPIMPQPAPRSSLAFPLPDLAPALRTDRPFDNFAAAWRLERSAVSAVLGTFG